MRKPKVENRYNLKPKDIQRAVILDRNRLQQEPFWRNNVINAWCLSGGCGKDYFGGFDSEYWIGFYDEDAKSYAGKIKLNMYCVGGMCSYNPSKFFDALYVVRFQVLRWRILYQDYCFHVAVFQLLL